VTGAPLIDRLVVCHGDACAPNTLINDDGRCCGRGLPRVVERLRDLLPLSLAGRNIQLKGN
jgi:kanamycin kinase